MLYCRHAPWGATKNDQHERRSRYVSFAVGILAFLVVGVERLLRWALPVLRLEA